MIGIVALPGCVRGGPGPLGLTAHSVRPPKDTAGPYRDLDAAVRFAAPRVDMAITSSDAADPTLWRYTLITTRDETVTLDIHLPADPDPNTPVVPTSIVARVGHWGDPARERELVDQITARLKALRKTGIAPNPDA